MLNSLPFEEFKENYTLKNNYCKTEKSYNKRRHKITGIPCNNFSCPICRPNLKKQLYQNVIKATCIFGFDKHLVLTSRGEKYRCSTTWEDSYTDMAESWRKLKQVVQYKYGKFDYILFPRSQKDGYCHYHLITNSKYIPSKFIDKKRKKYPNLGFIKIRRNQTLEHYLTNDFFKDHEYTIPMNKNHYYGSKEVAKYLSLEFNNPDTTRLILWRGFDPPIYLGDNITQMEKQVTKITGYPLPFEEYVKQFYSIDYEKLPLISGQYINGELKKPYVAYQ